MVSIANPALWPIVLTLLSTRPAVAEPLPLPFQPTLKESGWSVYTPRGKASAEFSVQPDGSLEISADNAVAFLYQVIPGKRQAQRLTWQWRVDGPYAVTDLAKPGADDRPIAVHVYFTDETISGLARLSRGFMRMVGAPVSGKAITYVWGGRQSPGTVIANPFMDDGEGVIAILRSTETASSEWVTETVDLARDFKKAFGEAPGPLAAIAVSADTDDTGTQARARIKGLQFETVAIPGR